MERIDIQILPLIRLLHFLNEAYTVNDTTNFKKLKISRSVTHSEEQGLIPDRRMQVMDTETNFISGKCT